MGRLTTHRPASMAPGSGLWIRLADYRGVICALSVVSLGERPLREVVVFGVQGLLIALYGCHRLWLARPVRLRAAAASPSRRDALRSRPRVRHRPAAANRGPVRCATVTARGVLE